MPFRLRAVRDHQPGGDGLRDAGRGHAGWRHQGSRRRRRDRTPRPTERTRETRPGDHAHRGRPGHGYNDGQGGPAARGSPVHVGPDRGQDPGTVSVADVMPSRFDDAIEVTDRALRTSRPLRTWLRSLRWCGDSIRITTRLDVKDRAILSESGTEAIVFFLLLAMDPGAGARPIHLPLSIARARFDREAVALEGGASTIYVMEAERREVYARFDVDAIDLFTWFCDGWRKSLGREADPREDVSAAGLNLASELGEATTALHEALIDHHPGLWQPEPFTEEDFRDVFKSATRSLGSALRRLGHLAHSEDPTIAESARRARAHLLDLRPRIEGALRGLEASVGGVKSVLHSDLHLAQVLRRRSDGALLFVDFEGEPDRTPVELGRKLPPLRDVGSLVRSFAYVRHYVIRDFGSDGSNHDPPLEPTSHPVPAEAMLEQLTAWEEGMVERFTGAYLTRSALYHDLEAIGARRMIRGWAMEKALYELEYELKYRVSNFPIPLEGIAALAAPARS